MDTAKYIKYIKYIKYWGFRVLCVYFIVKSWIYSNMIWDAKYVLVYSSLNHRIFKKYTSI